MTIDPAYLERLLALLQSGYSAFPEENPGEYQIMFRGNPTGVDILQDEDHAGRFCVTVATTSGGTYWYPPDVDVNVVEADLSWDEACFVAVRTVFKMALDAASSD